MGIVWQATDMTGAKKSVALKLIREEHASDPVQRKSFLNEAYLVDQLDHPNIIKVYERGRAPADPVYRHGIAVGQIAWRRSSVMATACRWPNACNIMRQLAEALTASTARASCIGT